MSGFSRIVQVLKTSTSASSCAVASPSPSDSSMPLIRSESWAFIWQPNVVTWYRRIGGIVPASLYFAISVALLSRITVTFTWPGYSS